MAKQYTIDASALTPDMRELLDIIGFDLLMKVVAVFGGDNIYIPKHNNITRSIRDKMIREEYDGSNIRPLAVKYNLTARHVRKILTNK